MLKGMFQAMGSKIDKRLYYRVEGKYKCSNCGRVVENVKIPKGVSIKQFFKENPCKNCRTGKWISVKQK